MSNVVYNIQAHSSTAMAQSWAVIRKKKLQKKFGDGDDAFSQAAPYLHIYLYPMQLIAL